ncbi:hypothetical protein [Nonomuraea sp. NPDC049158]|uniref:hypothetical protein n=1 Tax=Nonomuraea sp. NPDC049158 TaxID=3155649 RepID=UPI0033C2F17E
MLNAPLLPVVLAANGLVVMVIAAVVMCAEYIPDGVRWLWRRITRRTTDSQ